MFHIVSERCCFNKDYSVLDTTLWDTSLNRL